MKRVSFRNPNSFIHESGKLHSLRTYKFFKIECLRVHPSNGLASVLRNFFDILLPAGEILIHTRVIGNHMMFLAVRALDEHGSRLVASSIHLLCDSRVAIICCADERNTNLITSNKCYFLIVDWFRKSSARRRETFAIFSCADIRLLPLTYALR